MAPAQKGLNAALRSNQLNDPRSAVIGNLSGRQLNTESEVRHELERQLCGCVDWEKSVETMISMGTNTFVEIGPGNVLTGLIKRINRDVHLVNVSDSDSARKFAGENITSIRI
jgi:[acyl-carrier-protein] S-malonyltransferase